MEEDTLKFTVVVFTSQTVTVAVQCAGVAVVSLTELLTFVYQELSEQHM